MCEIDIFKKHEKRDNELDSISLRVTFCTKVFGLSFGLFAAVNF